MKNIILLLVFIGIAFSVRATDRKYYYQCMTEGESYREVIAEARIDFILTEKRGQRILSDINGYVRADWSELSQTPSPYEYKGWFNIKEVRENLNYNPRKYKNHSQFKEFDASSSYQGMWGTFILERNNAKSNYRNGILEAFYIFSAGDHIGGTVDLLCYPIR